MVINAYQWWLLMMMTNPMIGPWSLLQHSATGAYDLVMSPGKAEASGSPLALAAMLRVMVMETIYGYP